MKYPTLKLIVLPNTYGIYRLPPNHPIPDAVLLEGNVSITRSEKELTIVCVEKELEDVDGKETGWKSIKIDLAFDFDAIGVIAAIATPLAELGISIYVVSTFDTDYILVKEVRLTEAVDRLIREGHAIEGHSQ